MLFIFNEIVYCVCNIFIILNRQLIKPHRYYLVTKPDANLNDFMELRAIQVQRFLHIPNAVSKYNAKLKTACAFDLCENPWELQQYTRGIAHKILSRWRIDHLRSLRDRVVGTRCIEMIMPYNTWPEIESIEYWYIPITVNLSRHGFQIAFSYIRVYALVKK